MSLFLCISALLRASEDPSETPTLKVLRASTEAIAIPKAPKAKKVARVIVGSLEKKDNYPSSNSLGSPYSPGSRNNSPLRALLPYDDRYLGDH